MSELSKTELRTMLSQMGYSEKAIEEILKWYENNGLQAEKFDERDLHSSNFGQQKPKR